MDTQNQTFTNMDEVKSGSPSKLNGRQVQQDNCFSGNVIFTVSINEFDAWRGRKTFSVDVQLLSYSFLVRLINRTFTLQSNFVLTPKESSLLKPNFPITNDLEVDGCIMNMFEGLNDEHKQPVPVEFIVYTYPKLGYQAQYDVEDWCVVDDQCVQTTNTDDSFEVFEIQNDLIIVTMKSKDDRQETLLQKATNWLHGSVNSPSNNCLTKKEFSEMLDRTTGRLLDEQAFRQRIFDHGCDESIRKIVWCYLLRVFNESMTNDDKNQCTILIKEQYNIKKNAWQDRLAKKDPELIEFDNLILKDVQRTDNSVKFFDGKENIAKQKLHRILMTYNIYHPEPGYVQGMNDMVAPILYVMRDESLTYACFCALMCHMGSLFNLKGIGMTRRLNLLKKTIQAIDIELWKKIEECDVGNLMFAYRWLLLDCKREFPFKDIFRVLETLWASLSPDRFESNRDNVLSDMEDLSSSGSSNQHNSAILTSITNTLSSSRSCSHTAEETQSGHSSLDGADSGYREDQSPTILDSALHSQKLESSSSSISRNHLSLNSCILPLESWLIHFSSIDDDEHYSDMFTIFLSVAILEQNRSSIMEMSQKNKDDDDFIGSYFTRLVRQHDARDALRLARKYHRQYVAFQTRVKQLHLLVNT